MATNSFKGNRRNRRKPAHKTLSKSKKRGLNNVFQAERYTEAERRILASLDVKGVRPRELMKKAGIKDRTELYYTLALLSEKGAISYGKNRTVYPVTEKVVNATIISVSLGFAFARPEQGGEYWEDFFIHGGDLKGAFIGDEVTVTNIRKREKGMSARVLKINRKSEMKITGTVRKNGDGYEVEPDNQIRYNFIIPQSELSEAREGDKVLIEPEKNPEYAKIRAVFGNGESAKVCSDAVIERFGIPVKFSDEARAQACDIQKRKITDDEIRGRRDRRSEDIFTIDGADAKDLDDAISVKKTKDGFELGVHIADVSHYIKEGTHIDKEAMERGTSVYFADRVIPMLPKELSNGVCSLNPDEDKLAFSAIMHFDRDGEMLNFRFEKTVIRSRVRGVYSEVNKIFDKSADKSIIEKYEPIKKSLIAARQLARLLKRRSKARGGLELESVETKFTLDENGKCIDILPRELGEAEQLIEQMMVCANIAASKYAQEKKLPFIYRVHAAPGEDRVAELCTFFDLMGVSCGELKKGAPKTTDFAVVLSRVKGTQKEAIVSQKILRTMEKARYSHEETGHFGLALYDYSHFTSPIRRYPDTSIHRILSDCIEFEGDVGKKYQDFVKISAEQSSKNETRAVQAERSAESCYIAEYMKGHIGERHTGVISGATTRGMFVRLPNTAEGFVSLNDFEGFDFQFDGAASFKDRRSGRVLKIGDAISIIIASAQVSSGRVDFLPDVPSERI